jgi:ketosteroid isomerase-like protein
MKNQPIIDRFFTSYANRDMEGIAQVLHEEVTWYFLGDHRLGGEKKGLEAVVAFFDAMNDIMGNSLPVVKKLVLADEGPHLLECQHITTNREDGNNIDHHICVLWSIREGRIASGRHFFADPGAAARFFNKVTD